MSELADLPAESRREIRRIVLLTRLAGATVVLALLVLALVVHWGYLGTVEATSQLATVWVGALAFFSLSTLARLGHSRVIERTLHEVRRLTDELQHIAETDPLTGLSNLRAFQTKLETALVEARRDGAPVSLVVADLDNFKQLNDAFGHQFGDTVLRAAAKAFVEAAGESACAARLGGDEFALILPGATTGDAQRLTRAINDRLAALRFDEGAPAALGSFGIATFPEDGESVQQLFSSADGRMYSEKHRRKATSVSTLAAAARNLFVRVGRAMRSERSTAEILREVAQATRDEFALSLCGIVMPGREHHQPIVSTAASSPAYAERFAAVAATGTMTAAALTERLPRDLWVLDEAVPDADGKPGIIVLVGHASTSVRPDALTVVAVADLVHAIVANGRAYVDAVRAGRERDIHIDLARELASAGSLEKRVANVTAMISDFIGATSVSIEGLLTDRGTPPFSIASGVSEDFLARWRAARATPEAQRFIQELGAIGPSIIRDPANDRRIPEDERKVLALAGITSAAICPIRFDGRLLGFMGAVSRQPDFFDENNLAVLASIAEHLAPAIKVALLRNELEASYAQLEQASRQSLVRLADAAEARDPHTGGHLRRIELYSVALAKELGLPDADAKAIGLASTIHDLGKLGLPDSVLLKPGKLSPDDWDKMRTHPEHGERLIGDSPMFEIERVVARSHHERWDGSGYPDGLRGEQIPLPARIVAVADAFDALTTQRPYKPAWPLSEALEEIARMKGVLFCPTVVGALETLAGRGELEALYRSAGATRHPRFDDQRQAA